MKCLPFQIQIGFGLLQKVQDRIEKNRYRFHANSTVRGWIKSISCISRQHSPIPSPPRIIFPFIRPVSIGILFLSPWWQTERKSVARAPHPSFSSLSAQKRGAKFTRTDSLFLGGVALYTIRNTCFVIGGGRNAPFWRDIGVGLFADPRVSFCPLPHAISFHSVPQNTVHTRHRAFPISTIR